MLGRHPTYRPSRGAMAAMLIHSYMIPGSNVRVE